MKIIMAAFAFLKGLSFVSKFAGIASWIPGFGPVAGIVSAAAGLVIAFIKAVFEGLTICLANPVVFLVIAIAFGGGLWSGIAWDHHQIEVRDAKITRMASEKAKADVDAKQRLENSLKARFAAEEAAKAAEDRESRARADARRLRANAKGADANSGGLRLPSVLSLSKSDGPPRPN